jgi:hypothetical protein
MRLRRPTALTVIIASGLLAATAFTASPAGSAAPTWSIVTSPSPSALPVVALERASCPSINNCYAVGISHNSDFSVGTTLAERWNGKTWSIVASPNTDGLSVASLYGVSCPGPTNCYAVGYSANSDVSVAKTLVEHWNGKNWAIVPSPNPSGPAAYLYGVSCVTASDCNAVGYTQTSSLAEHWNGKTWAIVTSPARGALFSVSCSSRTNCFAVGIGKGTLLEHWNGKTWAIVASPNPAGLSLHYLEDVSCPSQTSCFAVGYSANPKYTVGTPIVERWNGKNWSLVTSPKSANPNTLLFGVSCASPTNCDAVGTTANSDSSVAHTLAEHWNGKSWATVTTPNPSGSTAFLLGVSCPTPTNCHAVGGSASSDYSVGQPLAERYA